MLIGKISSPRPSNQSWSLVSHCTSSPYTATPRTPFMDLRDVLLPPSPQLGLHHPSPHRLPAHLDGVFLAQVLRRQRRPNPRYTGRDRIATASRSVSAMILRLEGSPRRPCATTWSPRRFSSRSRRRTCLSVIPSSSAASFCVISFFFAFFRATRRSRSACVISSCPSGIPQAWSRQQDISTLRK